MAIIVGCSGGRELVGDRTIFPLPSNSGVTLMTPARGKWCLGVTAGLFGSGGRDGGGGLAGTLGGLRGLAGISGMPRQLYSGEDLEGSANGTVFEEHMAISFSTTSIQLAVFRDRFNVAAPIWKDYIVMIIK